MLYRSQIGVRDRPRSNDPDTERQPSSFCPRFMETRSGIIRKRRTISCLECHRAKRKCDRGRPCPQCADRLQTCRYQGDSGVEEAAKLDGLTQLVYALQQRLQSLETVEMQWQRRVIHDTIGSAHGDLFNFGDSSGHTMGIPTQQMTTVDPRAIVVLTDFRHSP